MRCMRDDKVIKGSDKTIAKITSKFYNNMYPEIIEEA